MAKINPINVNIEEAKEKIKIPLDVQKRMLKFFMRTSIPRKKIKSEKLKKNNHLPTEEKGG
jgi:hypothetical protein